MREIFILALFLFLISITVASAAITVTNWGLSKTLVLEDQEVVLTVYVESGNDTKIVQAEIGKSDLNITNQTYYNVSLTPVGSATKGNWIYTFKEKEGVYEIVRLIATDNASVVKAVDVRKISFLALKVVKSFQTSTTTTVSSTTSTVTTSTQITSQTPQPTQTTQRTPGLGFPSLSNPIMWILIALGIAIPFILIIIFLR